MKRIIETQAGFVAFCWTGLGLFSLKLPVPTLFDAEMEIRTDIEFLQRKTDHRQLYGSDKINIEIFAKEIEGYFSGKPVKFSVPVDWSYYTAFQKKVLQTVFSIPRGQVLSYKQVGVIIGNPCAARAVGGAVGSNRAPVIVPCHRVIASNGSLGGFSGGLNWKRKLLKLEGIDIC